MIKLVYMGDSPEVLIEALMVVIKHARTTSDKFRFGPINLNDLSRDGLQIQGEDLEMIRIVLNTVPGLALVEETSDILE